MIKVTLYSVPLGETLATEIYPDRDAAGIDYMTRLRKDFPKHLVVIEQENGISPNGHFAWKIIKEDTYGVKA